jgi:hypothetical protein
MPARIVLILACHCAAQQCTDFHLKAVTYKRAKRKKYEKELGVAD